ncbi:hypothetical protein BESB_068440 [Besnoitia besnoiti]|uniref:Uncharacterized protein n=1 Tax=Besnoitia besnoiti TaxID=94643 RepID=A0A2A9MEX4_BESBE|nr:hypothetical protein BESB_068440 [Besnoitia besnoiti]PFH34811.1 hypothetical protein BESB_068440 [Besnoitia besnoiti]
MARAHHSPPGPLPDNRSEARPELGTSGSTAAPLRCLPPQGKQDFSTPPAAASTASPHPRLLLSTGPSRVPPVFIHQKAGMNISVATAADHATTPPREVLAHIRSTEIAGSPSSSSSRDPGLPSPSAYSGVNAGCSPILTSPHTGLGSDASAGVEEGGRMPPKDTQHFSSPLCFRVMPRCRFNTQAESLGKHHVAALGPPHTHAAAAKSRTGHPATSAGGASLATCSPSLFVKGGAVQAPAGPARFPATNKQPTHWARDPVLTPATRAPTLGRRHVEAVCPQPAAAAFPRRSLINASSRKRHQLPPFGGLKLPTPATKTAMAVAVSQQKSAKKFPTADSCRTPLIAETLVPSLRPSVFPFLLTGAVGAAVPVAGGVTHPLLGVRSQQGQRVAVEAAAGRQGPDMPQATRFRVPPKPAAPKGQVCAEGGSSPFSRLDGTAASEAPSSESCVHESSPGRGPEARLKAEICTTVTGALATGSRHPSPLAQEPLRKRADSRHLRLGANVPRSQNIPALGLQKRHRQLPALVKPGHAVGSGTGVHATSSVERLDSLRAVYGCLRPFKNWGAPPGATLIQGTPRKRTGSGASRRSVAGKELESEESPLEFPVGLPEGRKGQHGQSKDTGRAGVADQGAGGKRASDIAVTQIRGGNLVRMLPVKETRQ